MKKLLVLFLVIISIFAMAGCGSKLKGDNSSSSSAAQSEAVKEGKTIKIAYLPITHALPLFEEVEELKKETGLNVELVKYGSWPELLDALNTGRIDGASVLVELAMKSKEQGIDIKAVALGHKDGNVIVVNNSINSPADLKGKTFAIPHRQSSHNILMNEALAKGGLTVDDIKITELAPTEMPSALSSNQIDAYCVAEPFGAKAIELKAGKVLFDSKELWPDSLCCALVLTDKFINEDKETAKKFVDSYHKAGKNLTPEQAKIIAKQYLKQGDEVLDISLKWISFDNLHITPEIYNALTERVQKYNLSKTPPKYEDFVDDSL